MHRNTRLVMRNADGRERPFPIRKQRTVIGSALRADVRIAVPTVAAKHCVLTMIEDELHLTDLGSEHGTLCNGRRVEEAVLADADEVTIGPITFRVCLTGDDEPVDAVLPEVQTVTRARGPRPRLSPVYRTII